MKYFRLLRRAFVLPALVCLIGCTSIDDENTLVLVVGVDPEHPYLSKQIRFMEAALDSLEYKLEVQQHQSAKCLELSNSGQVDGELWRIEGVDTQFQNLIRVPAAIWSHPELAFVNTDITLNDWKSLAPYRVAYLAGTKVVENNIEGIVTNQLALDTIEEGFELLVEGKVDVVVSDNIVGTPLLESARFRNSGIRLIEEPLDEALLYTYLHKKHAALAPRLAAAIKVAQEDGTYERIVGESAIAGPVAD